MNLTSIEVSAHLWDILHTDTWILGKECDKLHLSSCPHRIDAEASALRKKLFQTAASDEPIGEGSETASEETTVATIEVSLIISSFPFPFFPPYLFSSDFSISLRENMMYERIWPDAIVVWDTHTGKYKQCCVLSSDSIYNAIICDLI